MMRLGNTALRFMLVYRELNRSRGLQQQLREFRFATWTEPRAHR
jgi:hypothetical protein